MISGSTCSFLGVAPPVGKLAVSTARALLLRRRVTPIVAAALSGKVHALFFDHVPGAEAAAIGSDVVAAVDRGHKLPGDLAVAAVPAQQHDVPVQHGRGVPNPPLPHSTLVRLYLIDVIHLRSVKWPQCEE